ncbi:hypothetical protein HPB51_003670 [Rhipicephalus microplus]|uniref:RING-type domain-containing protein n=1 Tax=Rhipicephalus microplus TaxID=6941 RepID=A0A9J6ELM9_RHIMP|nr:hypothetical protein HPB51_003670 [Rhipicephalus microplus]
MEALSFRKAESCVVAEVYRQSDRPRRKRRWSKVVSATDERADVDIDVDDDGRARHQRPKRRSLPTTTFGCPVCGVTLRQQELQQHWQVEVDRLQGIARNVARRYRSESTSAGRFSWMNPRRRSFERVRSNRGQRRQGTQVYCPVCQIALRGPPELLAEHVNECLAMQQPEDDDLTDEDVDVDSVGESFDEYEWAGQSRVRATSLLQGGFRAAGWNTASTSSGVGSSGAATAAGRAPNDDEDVDLDVDGDAYGRAHSAGPVDRSNASPRREEDCVIPKEVAHVRGGTLNTFTLFYSSPPSGSPYLETGRSASPKFEHTQSQALPRCGALVSYEDKPASHGAELDLPEGAMSQVVQSLRERLRELESENQAVSKCLICMDPYENPVVSIVCWHVHCQECWLKTLGAKKLCPQCNSITSASDLRRIYL